jgi:WD40 repeat protein
VVPLASLGLKEGQTFEKLAWGLDGTIAAVHGQHIHFVDSGSGRLLETLHAHEGPISCLTWAPALLDVGGGRRAAVLASCSGDRRVRVWRSPKAAEE